jgi:hypothetical protein
MDVFNHDSVENLGVSHSRQRISSGIEPGTQLSHTRTGTANRKTQEGFYLLSSLPLYPAPTVINAASTIKYDFQESELDMLLSMSQDLQSHRPASVVNHFRYKRCSPATPSHAAHGEPVVDGNDEDEFFPAHGTLAGKVRIFMEDNGVSLANAAAHLPLIRKSPNGRGELGNLKARCGSYEPPEGTRARKYYLQSRGLKR